MPVSETFPVEIYSGSKLVYSDTTWSGGTIGSPWDGTVTSGNKIVINNGGAVQDVEIATNGTMNVSGGVVSGTTFEAIGTGAVMNVSGGTVNDTTMYGQTQNIYNGNVNTVTVTGLSQDSVGTVNVYGGTVSGANINANAEIYVYGGEAYNLVVAGGGNAHISGGVVFGLGQSGAGTTYINSGALVYNAVGSGSETTYFEIASGAVVSGLTITTAGNRVLVSGGEINNVNVSGGQFRIYTGCAISGMTVFAGGTVAFSKNANVDLNGVTTILTGATAKVVSGAVINLNSGSFISGAAQLNGTFAALNISGAATVTSSFADSKINANNYTFNGYTVSLDQTYADAAQGLAYTIDGKQVGVAGIETMLANNEITSPDGQLGRQTSLDGSVLYGGLITSNYTGGNYNALKGDALTSADSVILNINRDNTRLDSVIFGGAVDTDFDGDIKVGVTSGNIKNVCGGGSAGTTVSGNIRLDVNNAEVSYVYGGGQSEVVDDGSGLGGNVEVFINSGASVGDVYGGSYLNNLGGNTGYVNNISLNFSTGATVSGNVYGGCRVDGSTAAAKVENIAVNVSGGAFGGYSMIACGGFAVNGDSANTDISVTKIDVVWDGGIQNEVASCGRGVVLGALAGTNTSAYVGEINAVFKSGSVNYIYGGGWGQKNGVSTVNSVTISVEGGDYGFIYGGGITLGSNVVSKVNDATITIGGDTTCAGIFAGGATSQTGAVTIGNSSTVNLTGNATVSKYINGEDGSNTTLNLSNYTGSIGGIANFDKIELDSCHVSGAVHMLGNSVESWSFSLDNDTDTPLMNWTANSWNEFSGDDIAVNFATDDTSASWTLIAMTGSRGEDALDISGANLSFYNNGALTTDWQLTQSYNDENETYYLTLNHK
ncbi:MAG: hypothetical protein PHI35_02900 [Victivallaceae bacterium]|nr:hypothetical protein [Victivallaceae bacterium]